MYRFFLKRVMDIVVSLSALLLLSPVFLILIVLLATAGEGVFFRQIRPGKNGKMFRIIKFKTMTDARDFDGRLLPDAMRITPLGSLIRKTSLDEIPQLWNVLMGQMSLVGPRPLLPEYLPLYSARQALRHSVRPGITGWAQVNGRNAASWPERLEMDAWYTENISFRLDMRILFMTVEKVLRRSDVSAEGHVTVEPFRGES